MKTLALAACVGVLLAQPAAASGALEIFPDLKLLGALVVFFVLLVPPLNQLIFKPLLRVLDDRAERIGGERTRADRLGREADATLAHYEQVIREARDEAERARRDQLECTRRETLAAAAVARADAEQAAARARGALATALESARSALRSDARELAREAAARVLGRAL
jgi:F-type H+-transporting ATPase subunit b